MGWASPLNTIGGTGGWGGVCVCMGGGGGGGGVVGENFEKVRFDPLPTIRVCTFSGHLTHKG